MKKYKQVLAGLLAMNLTVYVMPTGIVEISASVESRGNVNTTEEGKTESAGSSVPEETTDSVSEQENTDSTEAADSEGTSDAIGENTDQAEVEVSDDTEDAQDVEVTEETDSTSEEETVFSDGNQTENEELETEETAVADVGEEITAPVLTQFKNYKDKDKSITVWSAAELILLSNCDAKDLKDITISLQISGTTDITSNGKITKGTDISSFYGSTTAVTADESQQMVVEDEDTAGNETESQTEDSQEENAGQEVDVQEATVTAGTDYTFQGIGTADVPFQGTFEGQLGTLNIDNTFFGGLSSKAIISATSTGKDYMELTWCGDGSVPMLAGIYQLDAGNTIVHQLPVTITSDSSATMGSLFGTVQQAADVTEVQTLLIGNIADYNNAKEVKAEGTAGNTGLICGTLKSGKICLDGYIFPTNKYEIDSKADYDGTSEEKSSAAGNAGGVIGVMEKGTELEIKSTADIKEATVDSTNGNAGGIVGLMQQGAKIKTSAAVTLDSPKITGGINAGGVVGLAEDVTFDDSDITAAITVTTPTITGNNAGAGAGGFIGKYTLNTANLGDVTELKLPDQLTIATPTLFVNNSGLAGGYFGYLDLKGNLTYTIGGTDRNTKKEITLTYKNCSARALGAIAGKVTNTDIAGTVVIQNMKISATKDGNKGVNYHGGLVGELGSYSDKAQAAYVKVSDCDINVKYPHVSESSQNGFGGIAGVVANGSILKTENTVKVTTEDAINRGGGIAGYAEKSVIDLSGITDLSGVGYLENRGKNAQAGWLVGSQNCALIYAEGDGNGNGWTYIRGKENTGGKQALNDIGNYGQIIRLHSDGSTSKLSSDLISIDTDHAVRYKESFTMSGSTIMIGSEDEFALLSILWNSRGYFSADSTITGVSFSNIDLPSKDITLSADIDLTGSGIAGLTRDSKKEETDAYAGTFDGGSHTIKLAIGETFGFKQDSTTELAVEGDDGYGEVIAATDDCHARQGLFAKVTNATIKDLTIDGNINISNAGNGILAGGIAGETGGNPSVSKVTVKEMIQADCASDQTLIAGGFYGGSYGGGPQFGDYNKRDDSLNNAFAKIYIKNCTNATDDTKIFAGGVIGEARERGFKFKAYSLNVGGCIETSAKEYAYVGGLIGIISGYSYTDENGNWGKAGPEKEEELWIEIKSVSFENFKIDAPDATKVCGGLFGSIWSFVGLFFMGASNTDDGTNIKLDVKSAEINAPNAEYVGGLAYRSNGNWEIRQNGIDLKNLKITAKKNVGLLVCRGEKGTEKIAGNDVDFGALYLNTTNWDTSYKIEENGVSITTTDTSGVFDEFVAYTTPTAKEITDNGKNGVISIATKANSDGRVGVDENDCTTYQNRTAYGKQHPTNACSRYYYDLDQCLTDMATGSKNKYNGDGIIDTPQELLLWSVYNYAYTNIQKFFTRPELASNIKITDITTRKGQDTNQYAPWRIGKEALDMQKYSYYPINYKGLSVYLTDTNVKFYNEEIETVENTANNKSTQGTDNDHTQHYTMHCGLFLDYQSPDGILDVNNVTFAGSVGMVNNAESGALIAGSATGYFDTNNTPRTVTVRISKTTLDGLKVSNYKDEEYAPLLINSIGQYLTLDVNNLTSKVEQADGSKKNSYTEGIAVASSLIGNVGYDGAKQINLSFLNIVLPDKKADRTSGIFTHSTFLESFTYAQNDTTSSAAYNFYSSDDWSEGTHKHEVTYGREITETKEFVDLQKWYYDEATYRDPSGLVYDDASNKEGFSSAEYLPYVYIEYNADKCKHEIKVNQRVTDIIHGCGSYRHPYQITSEEEMTILSDYMSTGIPRKDWRVTVTGNQNNYHTDATNEDNTSNDVTYQYDGSVWVQVENNTTEDNKDNWQEVKDLDGNKITIDKDFMRQYLLNAYYDLQGKKGTSETEYQLKLTDFGGFGTKSAPFRGMLTSSTGVTVTLIGSNTCNGLIPYSYGSVVRNLKIAYAKEGKTLKYDTTSDTKYCPDVCFGGVIGCVMGGDNIIDGVTVTLADGWLTLVGEKRHLIQVGGYVGSVSGGGVIFRNMTDKDGLTDDKITNVSGTHLETNYSNLYVNPYVGRVLDGFTFYEKTVDHENIVVSLENTNKNYRINTLTTTDTTCITVQDNEVTVNDAQGLLILSAIVNSGAASNGISNAYSKSANTSYSTDNDNTITYKFAGKYGKVRNADYSGVVQNVPTEEEVKVSVKDDQTEPKATNLPYLIQKYCSGAEKVFNISTKSNVEIILSSGGNFDMVDYGNGYQGIAARYVSNAVQGQNENEESRSNHSEAVIPELTEFNGNGNTLTMDMQVREYADDDFHAASIGGLFNILRVKNGKKVSNLMIAENEKKSAPSVSLTYYNAAGSTADVSNWDNAEEIGVGGVAGSLVGYSNEDSHNSDITVEEITIGDLTLNSPASAGGIFGNTGKPVKNNEWVMLNANDIANLLQPQKYQIAYGIAFNNCNYTGLNADSKYAAGGFVGYIGNQGQNPRSSVNGDGFDATLKNKIIGQSSNIAATDMSSGETSYAGGLFGYVGTRMFINMTDNGETKANEAILQDVQVSSFREAGGCIGRINSSCYGINNVTIKGTKATALQIMTTAKTGKTGAYYAGGIVGYACGATQTWDTDWKNAGGISNSSVENVQVNNNSIAENGDYKGSNESIQTNYRAGGIVGFVKGGITKLEKCTVNTSNIYGSAAGGIVGETNSEIRFSKCKVMGTEQKEAKIKGFSTASGILGFWNANADITIQDCAVRYLDIESKDWGVGALIGDCDGNAGVGNLYLFDSSAQDSEVHSGGTRGRWPYMGGIVGNLRNTIKASNVLFSGVHLISEAGESDAAVTRGLLFGDVTVESIAVNIAGISIQDISADNQELPLTGNGNVNSGNDYIAFADYSGTADADAEAGNTDLMDSVIGVSPYVVTSPKNRELKLYVPGSTTARYLYGDGASWTTDAEDSASFTMKAQDIWANRNQKTAGHYAYKDIKIENDFDVASVFSTYNANQETKAVDDFPVLQIGAGSTDSIEKYLDIVTDGAFSVANNMTDTKAVTVQTDVYEYDSETKKFVKNEKPDSVAFNAEKDKSGKISFSTTTDYDNDKNRFNLLTVTFTEQDADGNAHKYKVFVPVLVRRMLEIDFVATLTYGTDFRSGDYSNLENHVLESFGSSITGYLNYIYDSAAGVYSDYGWESYINAGGNMMDMKKSIRFANIDMLPVGTQLSLVDCQNGKVYYYTATGKADDVTGAEKFVGADKNGQKGVEVPLSCFKDSDGNAYQEPSISELVNAQVSSAGDNPLFVKVDKNGKPETDLSEDDKDYAKPTVRIKRGNKYEYYRLAAKDETGTYTITVPDGKSGTKSNITENYYLVMNVPNTVESANSFLNGSIQTSAISNIPYQIHYRKISGATGNDGKDDHENTASTYVLSKGYTQELNETNIDTQYKEITMTDSKLAVDVTDAITFPNNQSYKPEDQLYLRFVGGLQKTVNGSGSAVQFPSGTSGQVKFYVYTLKEDGTKKYYTYNSVWSESTDNVMAPAMEYKWESAGGNMELLLSTDGTTANAVSLQGLRDNIKGKVGDTTFYVEAVMEATLPGTGLDVIPESEVTNSVPTDFTKLTYSSQISTELQSLAYSTNRKSYLNTKTGYYRQEPDGAKLKYDADKIDQLGINLLDLQSAYLDAERENSFINTTAEYNLSEMKNLANVLKDSSGIRFTLNLEPKMTTDGTAASASADDGTTWKEQYQNPVSDAKSYLDVELQSEDPKDVKFGYQNGTWSWTIPKNMYYDSTNNSIRTDSVFDGEKLIQAILLKVDVTNVDKLKHFYSNYKVILNVEILNANGTAKENTQLSDNIIYTIAKISKDGVWQ